jgi:hypothetical protein
MPSIKFLVHGLMYCAYLCILLFVAGTNGGTNTVAQSSRVTLPFQPLALCFNHVNYYVDMPAVSKYIHKNLKADMN